MPDPVHPFFGRTRRALGQGGKHFRVVEKMDFVHPEGITAAQDGGDVVGIVDIIKDQLQTFLPVGEHGADFGFSSFGKKCVGHGGSFLRVKF